MIGRWDARLRRLRRTVSRTEWQVRLRRLSRSAGTGAEPGLVLIQIDGLSRSQLEAALAKGRMPFLARLLRSEQYRLHTFYSGLPSSTPAVQGELFYGVKTAVPAFSFRDPTLNRVVRMFDPDAAAHMQAQLEAQGAPLLAGGSAYSNIYSGGAAESHYCPATTGLDEWVRVFNPLAILGALIWNPRSFFMTAGLMLLEFGLAVADMFRGLIEGKELGKELKFVPSRVVVSILLRELVTNGAMVDATRGLPAVHVNFLGYDEQAHRRGPDSEFAHWSLKGIDDAVERIWRSARRSARRDYDVWIYGDHGQERTEPYPSREGRTIQEAVEQVFREFMPAAKARPLGPTRGEQMQRARWLNWPLIERWLIPDRGEEHDQEAVTVAAMGPVATVYSPRPLTQHQRNRLAQALVDEAHVPNVLANAGPGKAAVWNRQGRFTLPDDAAEVLGGDHPFRDEVAEDLVALCHHPGAGDFVLCGWCRDEPAVSFPYEHGAHAGPGPDETRAFALLPRDAPLPHHGKDYLRPLDLREAALHVLGRGPLPATARPWRRPPVKEPLRIMTYNVHSCLGMDGKLSASRIARVIAQSDADIVALQELDVGRMRSGLADQAHEIARDLEMEFHFHPALELAEERYGDAILSRHPMRVVRGGPLPGGGNGRLYEPRGALWAAIDFHGHEIHVINTHLGLSPRERMLQAETLLGPDWLGHPDCTGHVILCGDFNALPGSKVCRRLCTKLRDAQRDVEKHRPRRTWFSRFPLGRIDHVFVSTSIEVLGIEVPHTDLTRAASDHLPVTVTLQIE